MFTRALESDIIFQFAAISEKSGISSHEILYRETPHAMQLTHIAKLVQRDVAYTPPPPGEGGQFLLSM